MATFNPCPRCGIGNDDDRDGNCAVCANLTDHEVEQLKTSRRREYDSLVRRREKPKTEESIQPFNQWVEVPCPKCTGEALQAARIVTENQAAGAIGVGERFKGSYPQVGIVLAARFIFDIGSFDSLVVQCPCCATKQVVSNNGAGGFSIGDVEPSPPPEWFGRSLESGPGTGEPAKRAARWLNLRESQEYQAQMNAGVNQCAMSTKEVKPPTRWEKTKNFFRNSLPRKQRLD